MPYDRTAPDTTLIAAVLKEDDNEYDQRALINYILKVLNYSSSDLKSNSVDTIKTALDAAIA